MAPLDPTGPTSRLFSEIMLKHEIGFFHLLPRGTAQFGFGLFVLGLLLGNVPGMPVGAEERPRQTERLRTYDVLHIKAELKLDIERECVEGRVTHRLSPLHDGFKQVVLDCEQVNIRGVSIDGSGQDVCHTDESGRQVLGVLQGQGEPALAMDPQGFSGAPAEARKLRVDLERPYRRGERFDLAIDYRASPTRGLYFVKPDEFYPNKRTFAWTQGEPELTHFWLPCYDYPNDMATTEMIITVDENLFVLSNGQLLKTTHNKEEKTKTYHWRMDLPHVTYLISLVVADLIAFEDKFGDLEITSYVHRSRFNQAAMKRAYARTPEMLQLFNRLTGVEYPWPKYSQVTVPEFRWGGMENVSATTLYEYTLQDEAAWKERSMDGLIAHELAHQWWGDLLTCRNWSHLWLNEGFATYFDALFVEHDQGRVAFQFEMKDNRNRAIGVDAKKPRPVVWDRYKRPNEMFDARAYPKGACLLHMLRGYLGDDRFFRGLSVYAKKHRHQVVQTSDLRVALEQVAEEDLKWFFDQWCYKAGSPKLKVSWSYDDRSSSLQLTVSQKQKTSDLVPIFRLPTQVALLYHAQSDSDRKSAATDQSPQTEASEKTEQDNNPPGVSFQAKTIDLAVCQASQTFVIPNVPRPDAVLIDPEHFLLAEINYEKKLPEWRLLLQREGDPLTQILAADKLAGWPEATPEDQATNLALIQSSLKNAEAEQVRAQLVKALAKLPGTSAQDALLQALSDPHPLVRRSAAEVLRKAKDIPATEKKTVVRAVSQMWQQETAPRARAAALETLVKLEAPKWQDLLELALKSPSWRSTVSTTAIRVLAQTDHPRKRELIFWNTRRGVERQLRIAAVGALGELAQEDPLALQELEALLDDPSFFIRRAALGGLKACGDPSQAKRLRERLKQKPPRDPREREALQEAAKQLEKTEPDQQQKAQQKAAELRQQAAKLRRQAADLEKEAQEALEATED